MRCPLTTHNYWSVFADDLLSILTAAVDQVQTFSVSLLNGATDDTHGIHPQSGPVQTNLVPLGWLMI